MKILAINGSPKKGSFSDGSLKIAVSFLQRQGAEVELVRLADRDIKDCLGCFSCLKTGKCLLADDMEDIILKMTQADGFVTASSVRNGSMTACYKRFYERITYVLGFPLHLEDKYIMAICNVGLMGGKAVNKRFVGLQDVCHASLSAFIFCKTGIPAKRDPEHFRGLIESGAGKLTKDIKNRTGKGLKNQLTSWIDRKMLFKFMLSKHPEVYGNVIECWGKKGYIR